MTRIKLESRTFFFSIPSILLLSSVLVLPASRRHSAHTEIAAAIRGTISFDGGTAPEGILASEVIVYLLGDELAGAEPVSPLPDPTMDQYDYTFVPHVLPMLAGSRVTFTNSDLETHNIHTYTKGPRRRNRTFNRAQRPGSVMSAVFTNPDSIRVQCDIHAQMLAHIFVLPNPFFTMAAEDGTFAIEGVPTGSHELLAWHEEYGTVRRVVEVNSEQLVTVNLDFSSAPSNEEKLDARAHQIGPSGVQR